MKKLIRKWLQIHVLEDELKAELKKVHASVEAEIKSQFTELREFLRPPVDALKAEEKKVVPTRLRNFSQFRDKVEALIKTEL